MAHCENLRATILQGSIHKLAKGINASLMVSNSESAYRAWLGMDAADKQISKLDITIAEQRAQIAKLVAKQRAMEAMIEERCQMKIVDASREEQKEMMEVVRIR